MHSNCEFHLLTDDSNLLVCNIEAIVVDLIDPSSVVAIPAAGARVTGVQIKVRLQCQLSSHRMIWREIGKYWSITIFL